MLELTLRETCHIYFWQLHLNKTSKLHPASNWMLLSLRQSEQNPQPGQIWPVSQETKSENIRLFTGNLGNMTTRRLIKETAACYFIGYYIGGYLRAGQYRIINFKTNIGRYQWWSIIQLGHILVKKTHKWLWSCYSTLPFLRTHRQVSCHPLAKWRNAKLSINMKTNTGRF